MLPAFRADYIEIELEQGKWRRIDSPWIAVSDDLVSADGEFDLILSPRYWEKCS